MEFWKIMDSFLKRMICRFQPLIFQGGLQVERKKTPKKVKRNGGDHFLCLREGKPFNMFELKQ